jgi:hypothetical protein
MSHDDNKVILRAISDKDWVLIQHLDFVIFGKRWLVPEGFETDLASVPRLFWSVYPQHTMKYTPPAILHDFLYAGQIVPRKQADEIFLEAMRQHGVSWFTRNFFYQLCRMFGARVYNELG